MNFSDAPTTAHDLIEANPVFTGLNAVFLDLGNVKNETEQSLQDNQFSVAVWPPTVGRVHSGGHSGAVGADCQIVVRLEVTPQKATSWSDVAGYFIAILSSLLAAEPEPGGVKWTLSEDCFEMVNFDQGKLAYHIRFDRFLVFQ